MMENGSASSTSQISSQALSRRLSSSSSSPALPLREVSGDPFATQLIFPPFHAHRPPAISQPCGEAATTVNVAGFDPGALLQGGEKTAGDFDQYDGESEEGGEVSEEQRRPPPRSSSKRSRAAEVHNLSEKRRRSRINEKMKALQNLIPNSNKTDKASMLDEAIEYLKQLQLQVQMLSMRNGLNLQTMYLPGTLPALPSSQIRMSLNPDDSSLINMGLGMIPSSQDSSIHHPTFQVSKLGVSSHQQRVPAVAAISNPMPLSIDADGSQFPSFPFPVPKEALIEHNRLLQADHSGNTSGDIAGGSQQPQGGIHACKQQWKI
ncbi:uncharacterized protein LOC144702686 [Wolffia australiana]